MFESRSTGLGNKLLAFQQHMAVEVCDGLTAGTMCMLSMFLDIVNFRSSVLNFRVSEGDCLSRILL